MTQRRFEVAGGLGIWVLLDVAQRSSCHDFAAMNPSAWPQINNVIRTLNCLLIVLDHDERIAFVPQRGERFEQAQIVAWMQTDGRLVQHVKDAAQV